MKKLPQKHACPIVINEMIPDMLKSSLAVNDMYPKLKINNDSLIDCLVKNLIFLSKKLAKSPTNIPIPRDPTHRSRNWPNISIGVRTVTPSSIELTTVLNIIMEIAEFVMPSPKTIEYNFG